MRLLKTIGSVNFTGQERAALNKLTMPLGEILEDEEFFDKAKDEYAVAARVFERLGHVEKVLKAKTARFRIERREWFQRAGGIGEDDLSRLIEMRDTIEETLSLHGREISGRRVT